MAELRGLPPPPWRDKYKYGRRRSLQQSQQLLVSRRRWVQRPNCIEILKNLRAGHGGDFRKRGSTPDQFCAVVRFDLMMSEETCPEHDACESNSRNPPPAAPPANLSVFA